MEVELYDGTILEFPDDTPESVMLSAGKRETTRLRVEERKAKDPATYATPKPEPVGFLPEMAGKAARIGARGLAGLPLAAMDAGVGIRSAIDGQQRELPSTMFNKGLDRLIPAPKSGIEKGLEWVGSALVGARFSPAPEAARQAPSGYRPADPLAISDDVSGAAGETAEAAATPAPAVPARGGSSFGPVGADPSKGLTAAQKDIAERAKKLGMRMTPGQATGSRSLQQLEAKAESQPFSSGPFNTVKAVNARVLNRSFLRAIGEKGDEVTEAVIRQADDRIGRAFENAAKNNNVKYDDALQEGLSSIESSAVSEINDSGIGVIKSQLANILNKAAEQGGEITGRQYQNIRMALSRVSNNQDPAVGYWARQIREQLDDALIRSVPPQSVAGLKNARGQYRVLITALNSNAVNTAKGAVNPGLLANAFSRSDKSGFVMGGNKSPLYEALRFSKAFPSIVGDSGTATRAPFQGLTDLAMRVPAGVAAKAYLSKPSISAAQGTQNAMQKLNPSSFVEPAAPYGPGYINSMLLLRPQ